MTRSDLHLVDQHCALAQLAALPRPRAVTGGRALTGNKPCHRVLVDLLDLAEHESMPVRNAREDLGRPTAPRGAPPRRRAKNDVVAG